MHPELIRLGPDGPVLRTLPIVYLLATVLGILATERRAARWGIPPRFLLHSAIVAVALGLVGARLLYALEFPEDFPRWSTLLDSRRPGFTFMGGAFLVTITLGLLARRSGLRPATVWDLYGTGMPLVLTVGPVGCLMAGCCYGIAWSGPPGIPVTYPPGAPAWLEQVALGVLPPEAPRSLPVHAAQAYYSGAMLLLFLTLWTYGRRRRPPGTVFGLFLLLYAAARFALEPFRGDERILFWDLTTAQVYCAVLFPAALGFWLWRRRARAGSVV